ncbi:MAG: hypothetical protein ACOYXC_03335 [Candidatus Rifleibacteriota bacterium]
MPEKVAKFLNLLPESMRSVVRKHAGMLDSATADYLDEELDDYLVKIKQKANSDININLLMIERMIDVFKRLIKMFGDFDQEERRIVSAALRYFIDAEDARLDFEDPFGFDDDLAVLNAALLALGLEYMVIER